MRKGRKILAVLAVFVFIVQLTGCGSASGSAGSTLDEESQEIETEQEENDEPKIIPWEEAGLQDRIIDRDLQACMQRLTGITDRDIRLSDIWELTVINIHGKLDKVKSIKGLSGLKNLTRLDISDCPDIKDISALSDLTNLTSLEIWDCPNINDISGMSGLINLTELDIQCCIGITVAAEKSENMAVYLDFCARKEQENTEQMQEMLAMARESVYDVLKAYDNADMREYSVPSTANEIFADEVIDKICGGNSVAKAAVSEAVECFKSGEGLGDSFGRTMNAAVEAIPGAVKEKFVEILVPGCVRKMLDLYETLESNSNLQIKYAINKLQDIFQRDTEVLTAILLEENLTGDELKRAAFLVSDIYNTVYELENRFQVSMAMDEWWLLDACLGGIADEYYRCDFLAGEYHRAGEAGADSTAVAFAGTEEEVRTLLDERDAYYQDPENFVVQYSWLLGMKENLVTLKYFDYVQLQKDSTENFIAGALSDIFGNFITDMFAANKTENDNTAVDILYEYTDTCKQVLDKHMGGFESLANIGLEMDALYLELVNNRAAGGDEMRCALYFYQDYFGRETGPTYNFYRDRIKGCAGEITAYYMLLKNASSGQKALLNQEYLSNSAYLSELENELMWIEKSLYGENIPGLDLSVDISSDTSALSGAYSTALRDLCIDSMRVSDIYKEEHTVNVEGRGPVAFTCYRKRGLVSLYDNSGLEDVVVAIVLNTDNKAVLTCTYDCESQIKSAYTQDGAFAYYGIGMGRFGIVDCNLSEEDEQLWDFYPGLAGAEVYSDMGRVAECMALCVE